MKRETATLEQDSQLHKRQHHRRTQQRERRSHHKHKCPHGKKKDHLHTLTQEAERAQGAQKDEIKEGEKDTEMQTRECEDMAGACFGVQTAGFLRQHLLVY